MFKAIRDFITDRVCLFKAIKDAGIVISFIAFLIHYYSTKEKRC